MTSWYERSATLADSESLTSGTPKTADVSGYRSPTVLVSLEDLEGAADDDATIRAVGAASTYQIDTRTLSSTQDYTVDVPQCETIEFESSGGVTYSAEVRENHG